MADDFTDAAKETLDQAKQWAAESADRRVDDFARMVDRANNGTYTAAELSDDLTAGYLGALQDVARAYSVMIGLGTAIAGLQPKTPNPPTPPGP